MGLIRASNSSLVPPTRINCADLCVQQSRDQVLSDILKAQQQRADSVMLLVFRKLDLGRGNVNQYGVELANSLTRFDEGTESTPPLSEVNC